MTFPKVVAEIIADYCAKSELKPWIDETKLDYQYLAMNPMAWEAGMITLIPGYNDSFIAANPAAVDVIRQDLPNFIKFANIWMNPAIFEEIYAIYGLPRRSWWAFSCNPHPKAISLLLKNPDEIRWNRFSSNPGAIDYLRGHPECIDKYYICSNPNAIDIIENYGELDASHLQCNPHPWAIEFLKISIENGIKVDMRSVSQNPGIFQYTVSKELIDVIMSL